MNRTIKIIFTNDSHQIIDQIEEYVSGLAYFYLVFRNKTKMQSMAFDRREISSIKRLTMDGSWRDIRLKKIKGEVNETSESVN